MGHLRQNQLRHSRLNLCCYVMGKQKHVMLLRSFIDHFSTSTHTTLFGIFCHRKCQEVCICLRNLKNGYDFLSLVHYVLQHSIAIRNAIVCYNIPPMYTCIICFAVPIRIVFTNVY